MPELSTTHDTAADEAQSKPIAMFVSDVHLQLSLPRTTQAFTAFLERFASKAEQLYLLGDLFEYWAGDDDIVTPYNMEIAAAIRRLSDIGVSIYWLAGNRDFLVGQQFAEAASITLLPDPFVTTIANTRIVLAHGDAQCTDDHTYMAFRAKVREPKWQRDFLALPLAERKAMIENMRLGSREAQRSKSYEIMDVNSEAIASLFDTTGASVMIHGHTHRPATHAHHLKDRLRIRHVLPDWDCESESARGGWLAINEDGSFQRFAFDGSMLQT